MNEALNNLFERMSDGEVPNWFEVMAALNNVTEIVTLTERPPGEPVSKTVCELNGRVCND